jgi:hypothetical protein
MLWKDVKCQGWCERKTEEEKKTAKKSGNPVMRLKEVWSKRGAEGTNGATARLEEDRKSTYTRVTLNWQNRGKTLILGF